MPFKSQAQRRKLAQLLVEGKIPNETFEEWNREFPRFIKPMTATLVQTVPEGQDWMYEVKLDGYRALILKSGSHVQIRSRNDKSLSGAYPSVDTAAKRINADSVVLDGEIVAIDAEG